MTLFAVHGSAERHLPAERAQVMVTVSFKGAQRASVTDLTVREHNRLTGDAAALQGSGAATWWGAEQVRTDVVRDYDKATDAYLERFRAASQVRVRFTDFAALADWFTELGTREGVDVGRISWELTQATRTQAEAQVRIEAVKDALAKAAAYAAALERGTPQLEAVYEDGLRPHVGAGGGGAAPAMMRGAAADQAAPTLKPSDITVTARISADFSL